MSHFQEIWWEFMTDVLYLFLKFFAALLSLISPDDLPMTVWTSWEERKSGASSLEKKKKEKKNKHIFGGDGRERKHQFEEVPNECPQVDLGAFTYLCTTIWSILLPSALQNSLNTKFFPGVSLAAVSLPRTYVFWRVIGTDHHWWAQPNP